MELGTYESLIITEKGNTKICETIINKCKEIITNNNGEFKRFDNWGTKKLAYEIRGNFEATFTLLTFNGTREIVNKLRKYYEADENVLRHLFIRID